MEWISLQEAARLEGIGYETIKKNIQRNPLLYETKTEATGGKGRNRVFVKITSLSDTAQAKLKREESKKQRRELAENGAFDDYLNNAPWYVGVDFSSYVKSYEKQFFRASEIAKVCERYYEEKHTTESRSELVKRLASKCDLSDKQLYRYIKRWYEGAFWADEMQAQEGHSYDFYKILACAPKPKTYTEVVLSSEMKECINMLASSELHLKNNQPLNMLYRDFIKICAEKQWYIPSYNTVRRYYNKLNAEYKDALDLIKKGSREFRNKNMMKRVRNIRALEVMELVMADGHYFDFWCSVQRRNGKLDAIRPLLVGMIDARSRCLLGWVICEISNAETIKKLTWSMIYQKKNNGIYGVPKVLYIDNGKEFTAKSLTGVNRKERFSIDSATEGFYKSVGIEMYKRALPYQGWTKAHVERFFGTVCSQFSKKFPSYTGTLTGSRTDAKVKKDIKGMLKRGELPTINDVAAMFEDWLDNEYHQSVHSGLKEQGEENPIPIEVFNHGERYFKAPPPMEVTQTFLLNTEIRVVSQVGIRMFGRTYQHGNLAQYIGERVNVRYDENYKNVIYVYSADGEKICDVEASEGLHPLADSNDEALQNHIREQARQIKMARYNGELLQGKDRAEPILPEMEEKNPAVVSIPIDKQYRDDIKDKRKKKKRLVNINPYLEEQAKQALNALKKIN